MNLHGRGCLPEPPVTGDAASTHSLQRAPLLRDQPAPPWLQPADWRGLNSIALRTSPAGSRPLPMGSRDSDSGRIVSVVGIDVTYVLPTLCTAPLVPPVEGNATWGWEMLELPVA